jgi:2-amino-4-hydroxy-6-hydroxymethyldihydropteridine diphosphokinase
MRAFLGLGSNLAHPEDQIYSAIQALKAASVVCVIQCSRFYGSTPMGPQNQPDYINAVVEIETELEPLALLDFCQSIELTHHRERQSHWAARTLDIDILSIDVLIMNHERLVLPHSGIVYRDFVVLPWQEIAPNYVIPNLGCVKDIVLESTFSAHPLS